MKVNRRTGIAAVSVVALALMLITGCSRQASIPDAYDYDDFSDYIDLGNYKGIEYQAPDNEVSDAEVREYIEDALEETGTVRQVTSGVVTKDSVINMDYVGSIDGVEFEGGAASDVDFDIADNNYIDGFADGIIGHSAGETFDLHVTFPENYGNEDLAGRDAVFRTTINYIIEEDLPEYNDQWVADNTQYSDTAEYEEAVRNELLAGKDTEDDSAERLEVFNKILDDTEVVKYPEEELSARLDKLISSYKGYAEANGEDFEDYLNSEMGITEEQFNSLAEEAAENAVKNELVLHAIASLEGIELTSDDYNDYLLGLLEDAGYTQDSYKEEKGYTIQEYAEDNDLFTSYLYQRVMDKVMEYSVEKK